MRSSRRRKRSSARSTRRSTRTKGKINQLQKELNDRAHELAKDLKEKERNMFLSSKFAGIPASELNLDDNPEFHALELERLALRQEDATSNEEKIRDLERRMNDAAEELAKEKVQDERAFLKELGFDMDVLNAVLDKDPDFLAKEARLRELMKDPVGNASEINALKEEMAADAKRLLDAHKEGERGSYLKSEYEGHPTSTLPLGEDKEFSELEDAYLKLKNDPNASPEELQRLRDALDKRAAEIARDLNVKDRASYLQANYRGILTGALPLDADEEFKKLEQERARIIAKGGDPSEINARLDARADEIAKQMIVGDRAYLNPVQAGVPLELVPLDESEAFLKGEEERFHLKKTALDPSSVKLKERELNTLVEGIAAEMKENERKSFLDDTYNNVPRSALPLDTDEKFKTAEIDRLRAKKDGDADKVKSLEDLMKKRAQELAKSQKEGDRAFIHKLGLPVSGDLLDKILDNNKEFMDLESKLRALKKNPTANAREIKELEDKMAKLAGAAVVAYLDEERKGFLKSEYHGRPTETLPLTEDPEFKKLEAEYQALKNQPNPDRAKLKELEDKMNQRADEIARGLNEADRAGFLGDRIRGIPIASLPLEDDAAFKALEEQRAALLNDPSKADEVKKLEQKLRDRADEIAKAKLADDRAFLDNEPEGIPLACIELDKDPEFADKEEQRASLMADNHNGKNAKAIAALEDNMNQHAHARAKKLKEDHLKACVDGTVRGIPTDVLGLADDAECTKLIGQRAAALLEGDQEKAKALGAALNGRAHDLMDKRIDEIRSQLTPEQLRIPLSDLDLDSDEKYKKLEAEAAALMKDPKKNADQLKSLFNKMNSRAAELADEKAWKEREQYLTSDYEGRDLHALPLNSDDQFLALEKERREALKAGDTARAKELEDKLSARATDIARKLNADERAAFLGNAIRGVPLSALNLDDDEDFRKLESQRQTNKRSRGIGNEAVEESLRNRAEALAAEKLKSDRAFLDERPEGVLLRQVPIDDDPKFKQLEEKRAKLNSQGGSGDVKGLEDQMNRRAHELAALIKDSTRADLEQKPLSVALRDLPLDSDDTFVDLEEKYRDAKNGDSASLQDDLLAQLNDRAKELAQELHDKERRGLNQNPEGIPLSAINVNDDPLFVNLETDARSLRAKQPDSSKLKDLEKQLDARASELAHKVRKEYITGDPEGIPIEMLNLGNEPAFLKKEEERRRLLESDPAAAAKLTAELNEMACGIAKQKMTGDRDFLDQNPEGVPIDILPLDTDPKFHELELERAKLRGENATKNATKIKSLEGKMNERLHELAKEQKREDLKGLDQAPRGIPLETLNPHEDPEFAAMVNQLREYKKEPSLNADHIKKAPGEDERAVLGHCQGHCAVGSKVLGRESRRGSAPRVAVGRGPRLQ
ncbi:calpain cysteine peptidase [Angomonas deanei]|uniref:DUF7623 domain-containing protein n=1 Tax=Angomonas deanei TaxID=59799 RepID=A0A7G2C8Y1_9TRYP|nr:calpain cysteine peptidase [Angomonas deanei]CAD2215574.1 hypothetical protein, conserved [Angomonas deanei]|eukprot:EPY27093.1 calpain cysteine peptidase [Angomonas deanei]